MELRKYTDFKLKYGAFFGVLLTFLSASVAQTVEMFELAPVRYSKSEGENAVTALKKKIGNKAMTFDSEKEFLRFILKELDVSEASQTLVYSDTSLQKNLIFPNTPRALYFSDSTYVGYVMGGDIEVVVHDDKLGLVFYTIDRPWSLKPKKINVVRENSCLSCHATARTLGVPGVFIRSVFTSKAGVRDFKKGSFNVTDETPYSDRWGGWYVTGEWGENRHMGNHVAFEKADELTELKSLEKVLDVEKYLSNKSDVVALAVLEHQCKVHNTLVAAKLHYARVWYFQQALDKVVKADDETTSSWKLAESSAESIVKALLFCGEAPLKGDGLSGSSEFLNAFQKGKKKVKGRSLKDLRLFERLFKYRCSYMIHSSAFKTLPDLIKKRVFIKLKSVLSGQEKSEDFTHLKNREKQVILAILKEHTEIDG